MTGVILSGGKGTRISSRKALLEIEGEPVIRIILSRLGEVLSELMIVTNDPDQYAPFGVRCIEDLVVDKGPLGGIYSGLVASDTDYVFVAANDMPFLSVDLIRYMAAGSEGFDAVVPKVDSLLEPLHAVYSKRCVGAIERHLGEQDLRVQSFLSEVATRYVGEDEVGRFGDPKEIFFNINRKEDVEKARLIACRRRG